MNRDEIRQQANQLRDYVSRGGTAERWFKSKDFSKADRKRIEGELRQIFRCNVCHLPEPDLVDGTCGRCREMGKIQGGE